MSKKKEHNKLVPELRFPEFRNDEGWEPTTIGEVGNFYYGKSAPKWSLSEDAPTPCVRYGELYTKFDAIIHKIYSRTNIDPDKLRFSKGGEILVPRVGEDPYAFSNCSFLPFPNIAIGEMISVFETKEDPIFYTYYFNTLTKQFARVVEGQNVKNLYYVNLEPIKVGKPLNRTEQQKIAATLTSLDSLITAENEKLEALKAHKKGLLQQLFPAKGEKVPKLRFGEFSGEWEEKALGDVATIITGSTPRTSERENYGGNKLFVSPADISDSRYISKTGKTLSEVGFSKSRVVPSNSILFVCIGSTIGKVAQNQIKCATNQQINSLIPFDENSNDFVYSLLENNSFRIAALAGHQAVPLINKSEFSDIRLLFPKTEIEQQKIANCLSSLDDLITTQSEKIETLKEHKKGLMQQMFPV